MRTRSIGGLTVSAIGLGEMPMSIEDRPEEQVDRHHPRRAGRGGHADRHGRRLPPRPPASSVTASGSSPGPSRPTAATPATCWSPPRAATPGRATARGRWTARRSTCSEAAEASLKRPRRRRRSACTSSTAPTRAVPYADSIGALKRPARRGQDPAGRDVQRDRRPDRHGAARSSADASCRCRTSSRRLPVQRDELRHCARARHRVPALEPARRQRPGRRPRRPALARSRRSPTPMASRRSR